MASHLAAMFDLTGKVAAITGSSRGIGRAIAEAMAALGAKVVVSSRNLEPCEAAERGEDAVKLAEGQGMANWVQVDASKLEGVFKKAPDRDQFGADIKEALIVELYSR